MVDAEVGRVVTPLRLIFWGGLLTLFDVRISSLTNGEGVTVDVLSDAVGCILIALGVWRLKDLSGDRGYRTRMRWALIVSVVAVLDALRAHAVVRLPSAVQFLLDTLSLIYLVTIVVFCTAMRTFCTTNRMSSAAESWRFTRLLFLCLYVGPLGLFHVAALGALLMGRSFRLDLGIAGLLILLVLVIPIIHLFVSTSRMKAEAAYRFG